MQYVILRAMKSMLYILNLRLPTEKAHGLQITQNCEAFAKQGIKVTLVASWRYQTPEYKRVKDIYEYYGVKPIFNIRYLPSLDLLFITTHKRLINIILHIQQASFLISAFVYLLFTKHSIIYTRDHFLAIIAKLTNPMTQIVYEVHQKRKGRFGVFIQSLAIRLASLTVPITSHLKRSLRDEVQQDGIFFIAHDGVRAERFSNLPDKKTARKQLGLMEDAFIVTYTGRLYTLNMDKGVTTQVLATATIPGVQAMIVGGPDGAANKLKNKWVESGRKDSEFHAIGQVNPDQVPMYLVASDILCVPFPWNEHFAYYASPMKIFEYMASARPIVASNLPSIAEVLRHDNNAILVEPSNQKALTEAIIKLRENPALGEKLARKANRDLFKKYTWDKRASSIIKALGID